jgi:hypothetical protein
MRWGVVADLPVGEGDDHASADEGRERDRYSLPLQSDPDRPHDLHDAEQSLVGQREGVGNGRARLRAFDHPVGQSDLRIASLGLAGLGVDDLGQ